MIPEFDNQDESGADLLCPACGNAFLHHESVEVFERTEDADHGLHVTVSGGKSEADTNLAGNPSSRRHGLFVRFSCETCDAVPILTIRQHKGSTVIDFVDAKKR